MHSSCAFVTKLDKKIEHCFNLVKFVKPIFQMFNSYTHNLFFTSCSCKFSLIRMSV